jgi:hypothetical protein
VRHSEADVPAAEIASAWKVIQPERIPVISYPYEWCFSQLQAAALLTLKIQKTALGFDMTLKDASAYNVQFRDGRPVFIDTLSFTKYIPGEPWVAYGQFCRHFLAPLLLMHYRDVRLLGLLQLHVDGVPLDLVSSLLPRSTWFRFSILSHIHLHARAQRRTPRDEPRAKKYKVSPLSLTALLENLEALVKSLSWTPRGTEWSDYTEHHNYADTALAHKKQIVSDFLTQIKPASVWDVGANTGVFSRLAAEQGIPTVASDIDAAAVEKNYRRCLADRETHILPLVTDLTNPSPAIGWDNAERPALTDRIQADMVFALALVHHLVITHHLPFGRTAQFFAKVCRYLVVEFVPKTDFQVVRMLSTREDVFSEYSGQNFESAFAEFFTLEKTIPLKDSGRILYLMERKSAR